tara:strand:- start:67 stop:993 length:927 start_codon:yes stop_codon:yes gene_type:complete
MAYFNPAEYSSDLAGFQSNINADVNSYNARAAAIRQQGTANISLAQGQKTFDYSKAANALKSAHATVSEGLEGAAVGHYGPQLSGAFYNKVLRPGTSYVRGRIAEARGSTNIGTEPETTPVQSEATPYAYERPSAGSAAPEQTVGEGTEMTQMNSGISAAEGRGRLAQGNFDTAETNYQGALESKTGGLGEGAGGEAAGAGADAGADVGEGVAAGGEAAGEFAGAEAVAGAAGAAASTGIGAVVAPVIGAAALLLGGYEAISGVIEGHKAEEAEKDASAEAMPAMPRAPQARSMAGTYVVPTRSNMFR